MIENPHRYSVRVTPEVNRERKYSAHICVKELVHGTPGDTELHRSTPIAQFIPLMMRLGVQGEDIGHIMARFEHDLPITITADVDPEALEREGFATA